MRLLSAFFLLGPLLAAQPAQFLTPRTAYATYLGGIYTDTAVSIAVDSTGSAYIAGNTSSPDFPLTSTALGSATGGQGCAFVTKLNPTGTAIDFSVCLADSVALAMNIDASGNIYLAVARSGASALLKLDPAASTILNSIPIGGTPEAIAIDSAGNVYIAGLAGPGLATTTGAYQTQLAAGTCPGTINTPVPCTDAFAMKISPAGVVIYSTYLGGSGRDDAHAIAVDTSGNVWIGGETVSPNFPVTQNAVSTKFGGEVDLGPIQFGDGFVAELDPTGSKLLYSTYLGGSAPDGVFGLAIDSGGSVYAGGGTQSPNFPVTPGVFQTAYAGPPNLEPGLNGSGFITKFSASGTLVYSTYVSASDSTAIAVDAQGQAYVNLSRPLASPCPVVPQAGILSANASAIVATAPIGGSQFVLDGKGGLYATGRSSTLVFFSTLGALQTVYGGGDSDAFASKVDFTQLAQPSLTCMVNAASLLEGNPSFPPNGAVAPGEIVSLFGSGFGNRPSVSFNGEPAPILYAGDSQINAVVPFLVLDPAVLTVTAGGQTIAVDKLPQADAVPALFTINESGTGQAAILNQDSTVNSPSNPAARGSIVSVWMTGTGSLNPPIADGSAGPSAAPFPAPVLGVSASIGGSPATVTFAGQAPGLIAGVTQVNLQIPSNAVTGSAIPITIYVGDYASAGSVTMAIR